MSSPLEDVYCTLLMSDSYLPGAAVLAHSLRDAGTTKKLAVLVTLDTLAADTITELKALYDYIIPVDRMRNPSPANLFLMGRPDLAFAFTKIALWRQIQFRKIVYLDADVVALRALDELFDLDAPFAAAPDVGWPDAFNTGVMVLSPNMGDYWALQTMAASGDSFDGADQGLLNQYYEHRKWHRLPFTYNVTPNAQYQWEPAYRYYKRDISSVHFIGKDKPWSSGRSSPAGGSGVYNELLARWWAVYDRHLKAAAMSSGSQQPEHHHSTVQQHVKGESTSADFGTSSTQHMVPSIAVSGPEATTAELPLSEPGEPVENIDQGILEPTPTVEQRKFSAPHMEWDATRSQPPAEARPEAEHFPTATYEFSESKHLFQAPQAYPEPPKDMWFQVPETKPTPAAPPRPIFPWEQQPNRPKASRVFAEDLPPAPLPAPTPTPSALDQSTHQFSTVHYDKGQIPGQEEVDASGPTSPPRSSSPQTADEQWQSFQQSNTNAWDSVPGIDTYVRAIMEAQNRRGKPQVLSTSEGQEEILSPSLSRKERRESLIITDFPTAVERPSLPVTPAPVRRPTFWGEERDQTGELPAAEGVPNQAEWVCPQCGFSSVSASDFQPTRRESSTSTATAFASPSPSTSLANPPLSLPKEEAKVEAPPTQITSEASPEAAPGDEAVQDSKQETSPKASPSVIAAPVRTAFRRAYKSLVSPPRYGPHSPRIGLSPSGAPLASLTDPALLPAPSPSLPQAPNLSTQSSFASDAPTITSTSPQPGILPSIEIPSTPDTPAPLTEAST